MTFYSQMPFMNTPNNSNEHAFEGNAYLTFFDMRNSCSDNIL